MLRTAGDCAPHPVLVPLGGRLSVAELADSHGLLVCGGLTPGYADALVPRAGELRAWLADGGRPYLGFSAGAAIAATRAVVGGWRAGGVPVCPEDAGEDLDKITVVPGLGLTTWSVDVHCAQWGTLPRLIEAVRTGAGGRQRPWHRREHRRPVDTDGPMRSAARATPGCCIATVARRSPRPGPGRKPLKPLKPPKPPETTGN